jgi:hypothetical protein
MNRVAYFVVCATVLCCAAGKQAAAEPVRITSGSIVLSEPTQFQTGPINIFGTRGFSVHGTTGDEATIDPLRECFGPCGPTTDFSIGADLATFGIVGNATLDGQTYTNINSFDSDTFVRLLLVGTAVLPPVNGSSLVIRAPFTVSGSGFSHADIAGAGDVITVPITGGGVATVSFHSLPMSPVWKFSSMRYDFMATPEPSTLILVGGGLAAVLRARTRRRLQSRA